MSNQVYSNERDKYYPLPGRNGYQLSGDLTVNEATGTIGGGDYAPAKLIIPFFLDELVEVPGYLVFPDPNRASVTGPGVYSFTYQVHFQNSAPGFPTDIQVKLVMGNTDTGWDDVAVASQSMQGPTSFTNGAQDRYLTISYVGFIQYGGSIRLQFINFNTQTEVDIYRSDTRLIFCKLA